MSKPSRDPANDCCNLRSALHKLREASDLLSILIGDELARSDRNPRRIDCLYATKGCIACAIEESEKLIAGKMSCERAGN